MPEAALREAVLNAVVHKDYARSVPVQISVYADKLMIWNPGQLPADWTIDTLTAKHASQPFNPDIANAFFRAGMIESWGRGIERMFAECAGAAVPPPQFRSETTGFWTIFEFARQKSSGVTTQETTRKTTRNQVFELLQEAPGIGRTELADRLGLTVDAVKYHLLKLRIAGLIRHVGPTKAGHWEVLKKKP